MKYLLFLFKCGKLGIWLLVPLLLISCAQQEPQLNTKATVVDKIDDVPGVQLAWSPDGQVISTFVSNPDTDMVRLALLDLHTKIIRGIGRPAWQYDAGNRWSPDGTQILVTRDTGIWLVKVANGEITSRATGKDAVWLPDGQRLIVFLTPETGGPPDHFQIVLDTGKYGVQVTEILSGEIHLPKTPVTALPTEGMLMALTSGLYYGGMSISSDGQSVVYSIGFPDDQRTDLFLLNLDASEPRRLNLDGYNYDPVWSPQGNRIAYIHSTNQLDGDLYLSSLDGACQLRLTTGGHVRYPTWSPDGRKIALFAFDDVYILDVEKYLSDEYLNTQTCK